MKACSKFNQSATQLAADTQVSPAAGLACPPLSALAPCQESAASVPAHELLGKGTDQSETGQEEESEDQLRKQKKGGQLEARNK